MHHSTGNRLDAKMRWFHCSQFKTFRDFCPVHLLGGDKIIQLEQLYSTLDPSDPHAGILDCSDEIYIVAGRSKHGGTHIAFAAPSSDDCADLLRSRILDYLLSAMGVTASYEDSRDALGNLSFEAHRSLVASLQPNLSPHVVSLSRLEQEDINEPAPVLSQCMAIFRYRSSAWLEKACESGLIPVPKLYSSGHTDLNFAIPYADGQRSIVAARDDCTSSMWFFERSSLFNVTWIFSPANNLLLVPPYLEKISISDTLASFNSSFFQCAVNVIYSRHNLAQTVNNTTGFMPYIVYPCNYHYGHMIWDTLSGVNEFLEAYLPQSLENLTIIDLMHDDPKSETYGSLEIIFPELAGKVCRQYSMISDAFAFSAAQRKQLISYFPRRISKGLRSRVKTSMLSISSGQVNNPYANKQSDGANRSKFRILFSLRLQNRTSPDLLSLYVAIATRLFVLLPDWDLEVVIDGLNRSGSVIGVDSIKDIIRNEYDFVGKLSKALDSANISVWSAVGLPLADNIELISGSRFFVSLHGAGLVKPRWILDIPGFVLVSQMNLAHSRMLHIYGEKETNQENVSPCGSRLYFSEIADVKDDLTGVKLDSKGRSIEKWLGGMSNINFMINDISALAERIANLAACYVGSPE